MILPIFSDDLAEETLLPLYRAELLERPPVRSLEPGAPAREKIADAIARRDVRRLIAAARRGGFVVKLEKGGDG